MQNWLEMDELCQQVEEALANNDFDRAKRKLTRLIRKRDCLSDYFARGKAYHKLGRFEAAVQDFTVVTQASSDASLLHRALYARSLAHKALRQKTEAVSDLRDLLTQRPSVELMSKAQLLLNELNPKLADNFLARDVVLKHCQKQRVPLAGSKWAIVSSEWFSVWQLLVQVTAQDLGIECPQPARELAESSSYDPGRICNASLILQPETEMNKDPHREGFEFCLQSELECPRDYVLLPYPAFEYLKSKYRCDYAISRPVLADGSVELHLQQVLVWNFHSSKSELLLQYSRLDTVASVKQRVLEFSILSRVWAVDSSCLPLRRLERICQNKHPVHIRGTLLEDLALIESVLPNSDTVLFLETTETGEFLCFSTPLPTKGCLYCQSSQSLSVQCPNCKRATYCDLYCLEDDQERHRSECKPRSKFSFFSCVCSRKKKKWQPELSRGTRAFRSLKFAPEPATSPNHKDDSRHTGLSDLSASVVSQQVSTDPLGPGLIGLKNLGNTCYMNAVLQCLAHEPELTQYFLDIAVTAKKGRSKLELVKAYGEFLASVWGTQASSYSPKTFKMTLGRLLPAYAGYDQHDAHDLLCGVLNVFHAELNTAKKRSHEEVAGSPEPGEAAWNKHASRNQSIISEKLHGLFKSSVYCPHCEQESVTFEPFSSLSVPIAEAPAKGTKVKFFYKNPGRVVDTFFVEGSFKTIADMRRSIESITRTRYFLITDRSLTVLHDNLPVQDMYAFEYTLEDADNLFIQLWFSDDQQLWKYPRFVSCKREASFKEVHDAIFSFLVPLLRKPLTDSVSWNQAYQQHLHTPWYTVQFHASAASLCQACGLSKCKGCPLLRSRRGLRSVYPAEPFLQLLITFTQESHPLAYKRLFQLGPAKRGRGIGAQPAEVDLYECLEQSCRAERLDTSNAWHCPQCKVHVRAVKALEVYRLPELLVIHLKRFRSKGFFREKLDTPVRFPTDGLDLSAFVNAPVPVYDLYAVCYHFGSLNGGHYTAQCFSQEQQAWFEFNDSKVFKTLSPSKDSAYLLFYRQRLS